MSLQDLLKEAQGGSGAGGPQGLKGLLAESSAIPEKTRQAQREAEAAQFESESINNSFLNRAGRFVDRVNVIPEAVSAYKQSFNALPGKYANAITEGASDIAGGNPVKGVLKAGFRPAADTAEFVFAPLSAAIGSILQAAGGQKLIDKTGQKLADKSGITDWPAFQRFAMEHPNAGEDFNRLLNLATLGTEANTRIDPKATITELSQKVSREVLRPIKETPNMVRGAQVLQTAKEQGLKKLLVESQPLESEVPINGLKRNERMYDSRPNPLNVGGQYEPYIPDNQLPVIPFGPKGRSLLPTIQMGESAPSLPSGMRYDTPIKSPFQVERALGGSPAGSVEPRTVTGTGEVKTRGLSLGVEAKAVEKELVSNLGDLPEYQVVNMADQAQKATDIVAKDYEQAKRIAQGKELPPTDVLPESVFVAVEKKALKEGDVTTLRDLATGKLATEATTMGQRIRTLAERNPESPVRAIREIAEARKAKRGNKDISPIRRSDLTEAKKAVERSRPTKQNWADFIKEIQCK